MRVTIGTTDIDQAWSDTPVLSGISIDWGTDDPGTQPDPAVCSFTVYDPTGRIAGDFVSLAGQRFTVGIDDQILFDGIISAGGTIRRTGAGWLIDLTATSRMVLWSRLQDNGPSDGSGLHWTGTPEARLTEMQRRAEKATAPRAETRGLSLPASVAPYDANSHPSQLDLLHRLYAHLPELPLWGEHMDGGVVTIGHADIGRAHGITLDRYANPLVIVDGIARYPVQASDLTTDDDLSLLIAQPLTGITINAKNASTDDQGKPSFDDATIQYSAQGLPEALTATIKTMSLDSDAIVSSTIPSYQAVTISQEQRDTAARWLTTMDTCCTPETVTFDSDKFSLNGDSWMFKAQPSGPFLVVGSDLDRLTHPDGTPTATGPWQTIGGTITIDTRKRRPHITHQATIIPVPQPTPGDITWDRLTGWPAAWGLVTLSWSQFATIEGVET